MQPFVDKVSPAKVGQIASFNATSCLNNQLCLGQRQIGPKAARIATIPQSTGIAEATVQFHLAVVDIGYVEAAGREESYRRRTATVTLRRN